jgi:TetR/AcrR family transcriptional regulator, transcriptional repressor for nem operon
MASPRRVGSDTSKTHAVLLDSAEQLMLDRGYAAVTYRNVAANAGVYAGLVSYYFPTLDELFVALLRRRSERNLERLVESLDDHADQPLRALWEFNTDETSAALMMEFLALANHRKSIRAEIAEVTRRARKVQLDALTVRWPQYELPAELSPGTLLFLIATLPKMMQLEESVGISASHDDVLRLVEHYLSAVEPRRAPRRRSNRRSVSKATG